MKIEVSNGEIIDKYTILEIKLSEIKNPEKLVNINNEYEILTPDVERIYAICKDKTRLKTLHNNLLEVNKKLWKIEDDIRECERNKLFDQTFIDLARSVYFTNDQRAKIKNDINKNFGSELVEVKSYEEY